LQKLINSHFAHVDDNRWVRCFFHALSIGYSGRACKTFLQNFLAL
jgi:hypothetical protein